MKTRGFGVRRAARHVSEFVDNAYAQRLPLSMTGPSQRVLVVGIYRDPWPLRSVVEELDTSRHEVVYRLGAMGQVAEDLRAQTARGDLRAGKFQNLNELLADDNSFDWLLIVDDDVSVPPGFLDRAIEVADRFDFALAQPAQSRFSHANWSIARRRLLTLARETEFVEIGPVTLMRADALRLLTPFPAQLKYGWGLDFHWAHVIREAGLRMGVIDALAVEHGMRAVASTYSWDAAQEEGRSYLRTVPHLPPDVARGSGLERHRWPPRPRTQENDPAG